MIEPVFSLQGKKVWVAGHRGMVGAALVRRLAHEDCEIVTAPREQVDLTNWAKVSDFMQEARPDVVLLAAAKVGGILANDQYPVDFLEQNLLIQTNVIKSAHENDVSKLVFLGSSCIYPRLATQPITEDSLLTGPLEPTNEWYAIAKIAGIKLCQAYRKQYGRDFVSCMPTNLYGPHDNFDLASSHVMAALLVKANLAKHLGLRELKVWGSGRPLREFMHVDDCADAVVHVCTHYSEAAPINIGSGDEVTIRQLAEVICDTVEFQAKLSFDESKPDGAPRKLMDSSRLRNLGWNPRIPLRSGLVHYYSWYLQHVQQTSPAAT